jgi:GxxExxY protein
MNHRDTENTEGVKLNEWFDGRSSYPLKELTGEVIGAAIEVHKELGPGYLESTYESALAVEFELRGICASRQHQVHLMYKGYSVGEGRLDFLVETVLVVELKAVEQLIPLHTAQVMSYLKVTGCRLGLLLNFNTPIMKNGIRRIIKD